MLWRRSCRPRAGVHTPRAPFSLIRWISEMLNWHYRNLKSTQNVDAFPILVKFITILIVIIQINFINVKKYYICNSFHLAKSRRKHFEIHRNRWNSSSKLWFLPWENYKPRVCCCSVTPCICVPSDLTEYNECNSWLAQHMHQMLSLPAVLHFPIRPRVEDNVTGNR